MGKNSTMPFKYALQKVLSLMEQKEKSLDADVLAKTTVRDELLAELKEIEARQTAAEKGLKSQMESGATTDVAAANDYIQMVRFKYQAQDKKVKSAQYDLDLATAARDKQRQEKAKIEKHREMKLADYKILEKKKEAQRTDEMAGTIFMKKRLLEEEARIEEAERLERLAKLALARKASP
jgi:flagellar export protein FliJ